MPHPSSKLQTSLYRLLSVALIFSILISCKSKEQSIALSSDDWLGTARQPVPGSTRPQAKNDTPKKSDEANNDKSSETSIGQLSTAPAFVPDTPSEVAPKNTEPKPSTTDAGEQNIPPKIKPEEKALKPKPEEQEPPKINPNPKDKPGLDHALLGKWTQTSGGVASDFAEGGYEVSEIEFTPEGTLILTRVYGKRRAFPLTRKTDYQINKEMELLIGKSISINEILFKEERLFKDRATGEMVRVTPAKQKLPLKLKAVVNQGTLKLGNKTYQRIPEPAEQKPAE